MCRVSEKIRQFQADERGMALILVSIMLPVIIGFALLAIDMSRANSLHNDLQKGADAFAIAAAAELDGRDDSWVRAERALANLVDNDTRFAEGGPSTLTSTGAVTVDPDNAACRSRGDIQWCFLETIPASDTTPISASNHAATPDETEFIQVRIVPTDFSAIFPASFLSGNAGDNDFEVVAEAVAGNSGPVVCNMVPVFICNPFPGQDLYEIANSGEFYNKGIKLVIGNTSWGPGNFGFLRPESEHGYGENVLATDIARGNFSQCVSMRRVYTQTGNLSEKVKAAFNTRFDIYGSHFAKDNANWPPAPNVRKGFKVNPPPGKSPPDPCDMSYANDLTNFHELSKDSSFSGQIGNGMWDYEGYLDANNYTSADMAGFVDSEGNAYSNANPPSRYDLYKYELSTRGTGNDLVAKPSAGGETGVPACSPNVGDAKRRLIYAAILDCSDPEVIAELNGQSGAPPAIGFASFFLTEAVVDDVVYAEVVDIDGARGRGTMTGFAKDNVQLYR